MTPEEENQISELIEKRLDESITETEAGELETTLKASKEVRLGRVHPKTKYDADIGLLALAVSSREQAAPEVIAALTDLGVFPEPDVSEPEATAAASA